jgi:uncharacterized protein YbaP (TraB family)
VSKVPFAYGNHWIATKGNRRIHVIGTIHLADPRLDPVVAALRPVLAEAGAVYFESTMEEVDAMEAALARDPSRFLLQEGPSLIDRMPPEAWQRLADLAAEAGIPSWMAAKMQPGVLGISLSVPKCAQAGGCLKEGLDRRLNAEAQRIGLPVRALEDPQQTLASLGALPVAEQIRDLQLMTYLDGRLEDNFATVRESYFAEEVILGTEAMMAAIYDQAPLPRSEVDALWDRQMAVLLDQRNAAWIPVIEAAAEDRLVVAVGALHLGGDQGVLHLLQAEGYTLTRLPFGPEAGAAGTDAEAESQTETQ